MPETDTLTKIHKANLALLRARCERADRRHRRVAFGLPVPWRLWWALNLSLKSKTHTDAKR